MKRLTSRESILLIVFAFIVPIYPAILIMDMRHGEISYIKLLLLTCAISFLIIQFFKRGFNLEINTCFGNIEEYLDSHYTDEEQSKIITNYKNYKSRFWNKLPMFSRKALQQDPNLKEYKVSVFYLFIKIYALGIGLGLSVVVIFFIFAWF